MTYEISFQEPAEIPREPRWYMWYHNPFRVPATSFATSATTPGIPCGEIYVYVNDHWEFVEYIRRER